MEDLPCKNDNLAEGMMYSIYERDILQSCEFFHPVISLQKLRLHIFRLQNKYCYGLGLGNYWMDLPIGLPLKLIALTPHLGKPLWLYPAPCALLQLRHRGAKL